MEYLRKQIEQLKRGNAWLQTKVEEAEKVSDDHEVYGYDNIGNLITQLKTNVMYNNMVIEICEYYLSKVDPAIGKIKLGRNLNWYFGIFSSQGDQRLHMDLVLDRDTGVDSKLYDYVFGSHSGIGEWVDKHIVPLVSVMLGSTAYSHALGSWDLSFISRFFEHCGKEYDNYNKSYDKYGYWSQEKYDSDVEQAKKLIDWLIELSTKQELMDDIDRVLDTYFEVVFKHNGRE